MKQDARSTDTGMIPQADQLITTIADLSVRAGHHIMDIRQSGFEVEKKADCSPVTRADREAEEIIVGGLSAAYPDIPIVAEENASEGGLFWSKTDQSPDLFFLVDPLDGTKEFTSGRKDFTVNVGLIYKGFPLMGVVFAPAHGTLFTGNPDGACRYIFSRRDQVLADANKQVLTVQPQTKPVRIVASRSHNSQETQNYIDQFPGADTVSVGSSLKFCIVAEGKADIYPRFSPTMEWDTAAGDAVLRAAGGLTVNTNGEPLSYGNRHTTVERDFENTHFIAHAPSIPLNLPLNDN